MPPGVCLLCEESRELCNSHIIPEFVYKALYDDKHRFHTLSVSGSAPPSYGQKGLRERLLCASCETQLSVHERYVNLLFTGQTQINVSRKGSLIEVNGIDYRHFRLFGMSILWRAHVSNLPFFAAVDLGPHEPLL